MRYKSSVSTFGSGELSPDLRSRDDLKQHNSGLKLCENFIIAETGAAYRRGGSIILKSLGTVAHRRIHRVRTDISDVVLIFELDDANAGNLDEFMANVKVWDRDTNTITDVLPEEGAFHITRSMAKGSLAGGLTALSNLRIIQIGVETWVCDSTGDTPHFRIRIKTNSVGVDVWTYTCPTLNLLSTAATNTRDQLIAVIKANPIAGASGEGRFALGSLYFLTAPVATQGEILANGYATSMHITGSKFNEDEVGHLFYVEGGTASESVFLCIARISDTELQGILLVSNNALIGIGNASSNWKRSAYGNAYGYPQTIGLYQGRLHTGATRTSPLLIWASDVYDLDKMMNTRLVQDSTDTDNSGIDRAIDEAAFGFSTVISLTGLAKITSLGVTAGFLFVGTTVGDHQIGFIPSDVINIYARDTITATQKSDNAAANSVPVYADSKLLYVAAGGESVRAINILDDAEQYENVNVSVLSNIMFQHAALDQRQGNAIVQAAYLDRTKTVWYLTDLGGIVVLTKDSGTGVVSWSRQRFFGRDGKELSVKSISDNLSIDSGSGESIYVLLSDGASGGAPAEDFIVLITGSRHVQHAFDNALLDMAASATVTSEVLTVSATFNAYMANQLVDVQVMYGDDYTILENVQLDGAGQATVTGLADSGFARCGFKFKSKLHSLSIHGGNEAGTARGDAQRIDRLTLSLYNARGGMFGQDDSDLNDIEYTEQNMDGLSTGDVTLDMSQDSSRETSFVIETDSVYPMTVTSVTSRGVS